MYRQHRTEIAVQMRSQILRQIAHKFRGHTEICRKFMCKMPVYALQSRQAVFVRCCLYIIIKQNAHLFNAIFEQNNDVFYQKREL